MTTRMETVSVSGGKKAPPTAPKPRGQQKQYGGAEDDLPPPPPELMDQYSQQRGQRKPPVSLTPAWNEEPCSCANRWQHVHHIFSPRPTYLSLDGQSLLFWRQTIKPCVKPPVNLPNACFLIAWIVVLIIGHPMSVCLSPSPFTPSKHTCHL